MLKSYKYRIYPNKQQEVLLSKHFGCSRYIYNYGLALKIKAIEQKQKLTCIDIMNTLSNLKKQEETKWLSEVNSQCLQMALRNLDNAFQRFWREKKGFPKFKSKKNNHYSFNIPQKVNINIKKHRVYIPKFREGINTIFHREFNGEIRQATVSKTASGKYFISILVENNEVAKVKQPVNPETTIGIDIGIKIFIVSSDGQMFENPKFLRQSLKRLKVYQKRLSRKVKGSKNRNKYRIKVARLYEYITNQRLDYIHKVTYKLTHNPNIKSICIECLNVKGMVKNHKLAQALSDISIGKTYEILGYKCNWEGINLIEIGRFDPSSKICNVCGTINNELTLKDREWVCKSCNTLHDRDRNAAINIKKFGLMKVSGLEQPVEPVELPTLVGALKQEAKGVSPW